MAVGIGGSNPSSPTMIPSTERLANKLDFLYEVLEDSPYAAMDTGLRAAADRLRELEDLVNPGDAPDHTIKGRLSAAELKVAALRAAILDHRDKLVRIGDFDGVDQELWSILKEDNV